MLLHICVCATVPVCHYKYIHVAAMFCTNVTGSAKTDHLVPTIEIEIAQ